MVLPMLAFEMGDEFNFIRLMIDEVYGYPDELSYPGGYGAKGRLTIRADAYVVNEAIHHFSTAELYHFLVELERCYLNASGTASLNNTEHEMTMECIFDKLGHVDVVGKFQTNDLRKNCLFFELPLDQTYIPAAIKSLQEVRKVFGNSKEVTCQKKE